MSNFPLAIIKSKLDKIKFRYQQKYGAVIFDVQVKNIGEGIVLSGMVLSEKQKKEVFLAVSDAAKSIKIENKIKVLSDSKENLEIGWGVVGADIIDIWAKLQEVKNIAGRSLATQAVKGDFVRVLAKKNKWSLVQTRDLAIGWTETNRILNIKNQRSIEFWKKVKKIRSGEAIKKRLGKNIQGKFMRFLKKYLGVRYLLGGMSEQGIDCSGLTERFYSDIFGIILPRHSSDQAACGGKIKLNAAHFGDLIFLRNRMTKSAHIGIVVEKFEKSESRRQNLNQILVLNARKEKNMALIEDLPEILKSYNLISVKRIIK